MLACQGACAPLQLLYMNTVVHALTLVFMARLTSDPPAGHSILARSRAERLSGFTLDSARSTCGCSCELVSFASNGGQEVMMVEGCTIGCEDKACPAEAVAATSHMLMRDLRIRQCTKHWQSRWLYTVFSPLHVRLQWEHHEVQHTHNTCS